MKSVVIDGKKIGFGYRPYIVAEVSANHNGRLDKAIETITAAKQCGADAVKIQSYHPDTMTIPSSQPDFVIKGGPWDGYNLYDLYAQAQTPFEWHKDIFEHAHDIGITCFSTPFDETAVDLLEDLNAPAYKIASFEAIDLPLIKYVAQTKKPMIISTGMANLDEISEAVDTARANGCNELILLHCISSYPAPVDQSNLLTMVDLGRRFNCTVGLSDHTLGTTASVTAVAIGASFIEKHFIIDRRDKGPDSDFSLEPDELVSLVNNTRDAFSALGSVGYDRKQAEESNAIFRRSIYFVKDLKAGDVITHESVRRIRPGYGLAPKYLDSIIGRKVIRSVARGDATTWDNIDTSK